MKYYFVIIGDIIKSRQMPDRSLVQEKFSSAIDHWKSREKEKFVSPPTLTIGDEFQAVCKSTVNLFLALHQFEAEMQPVEMRFGLGLGSIATPINQEAAIGMDGSAFHNARTAIETARKENRRYVLISSPQSEISTAWQLLLQWIDLTLRGWPSEKRKILLLHRQGKRQKEIARILNISQPAVSQHINRENFSLLLKSELYLEEQIETLL